MNTKETILTPHGLPSVAGGLLILVLALTAGSAPGAPVIDPTGASYTSVSANSSFNSGYLPNNLFDVNVSSVQPGDTLTGGSEWATASQLTGNVAFQLDNEYAVSSLYYAQRGSSFTNVDEMNLANIWTSMTTPFDPNNPPVTTPDSIIVITNTSGIRTWTEYAMGSSITGKYFLVQFMQTNGNCCNPGGSELRLGGMLPNNPPPSFAQMPASNTLYAGGTARFNVIATDGNTSPLYYQWKKGTTPLTNDARISGATAPNLEIVGVLSADAGNYSCSVTNSIGSTNSTAAALTVLTAPTTGVGGLVVSDGPLAYYRFEEGPGATVAVDNFGGFDAAYGVDSALGNPGPQSPAFPGFSASNTALGTTLGDATSVVTVPPLNLNTNTVTIIGWINPVSTQDPYASLIVWRGGGAAYGVLAYGGKLCWIWNNIGWYEDSGLVIPQNQWSMVAMVVTSTNTTLYLGANGALGTYVSPNSNPAGAFDSTLLIGCDSGSRVFNGKIDDVAFFSHSLTAEQIQAIYASGVGQVPISISQSPVSRTNYVGGTARFNVVATGSTPVFQWKKGSTALTDGGNISGAHTPDLTIANVSALDAASYSCVVSNSLGAMPSTAASLGVLPAPTNGYAGTILAYKPLAYWQLDEASGAPSAVDYWGSFDGTPLPDAALGVNGPQAPAFPGFTSTNTGLQTAFADGNSSIAVPALNLNVNTATFLMWVYPNGGQVAYSSLFANRSGGFSSLNYLDDGLTLSFQWDSYGWNSGIQIPSAQWSLVGMVISPTSTTVYLGTGGVLTNNTEIINNPALSFAGTSYIGSDSGNNTRVFDGLIDDVAVFNRALSTADVATIYGAAQGQLPSPLTLNWSATPSGLVLTWYGPWTLIQADSLTGPWTTATGVTSGTPIPMGAAKRFYRLQH